MKNTELNAPTAAECGSCPEIEEYKTKTDVARCFEVTERTIEVWMGKGYLPYYRIGRTVRFRSDDIRRHLERNFRVAQAWRIDRPQTEGAS